MRFTKIPLIATLMAVALSLLIVLPGLAQADSDITEGKQGNVLVSVGVFEDIADAQAIKLVKSVFPFDAANTPPPARYPFVPIVGGATTNIGTVGEHTAASDPAYLADRRVDPQNTFFRNTLYASNNVGAFNTVLINVDTSGLTAYDDTCVQVDADDDGSVDDDGPNARVTATVKNNRSNQSITVELVRSAAGGTDSVGADGEFSADAGDSAQAFFKVVESGDKGTFDPDADTADDEIELEYRQFGGPTWCASADTRDYDATPTDTTDALTPVNVETQAESAVYGPVALPGKGLPLAADPPAVQQEIATIFAKHGDRLTVTTSAGSGQVQLVVDGDGPDFSAVTPADNAVTRPSRLTFSFEVRDDDSGLRHDGEAVISPDNDLQEINPDGDAALGSEPLSVNPNTAVPANGASADIDVNVVMNPRSGSVTRESYDDVSASGTWRMTGSRAGVAYAFTASGADRDDDPYLYQLVARDRAGNETMTDADDRTNGAEPFVFRVDDDDPDLIVARTGITYDTDDNVEEVDRSYIALEFRAKDGGGADALGDVDTDNVTVVGSTIVGVIHPSVAPRINRGEAMADVPPTANIPPEPAATRPMATEPSVAAPTGPNAGWNNRFIANVSGTETYDATDNPKPPLCDDGDDTTTADANTPTDVGDDCSTWDAWIAYEVAVDAQRTWDSQNRAYKAYSDNKAQYEAEHPGVDIRGERITEPRALIYLELAEDLASDAEPTVLVVGGAVFDLAGNTNPAKTLNKAQDWIAPKLTVTITGTMNDRPVANDKGSFSIDVRSDEDVARRPSVYFVLATAKLNKDGDGYDYTIAEVDAATSLTQQEDENHWAKKYKANSIGDDYEGLIGVVVLAKDESDNSGAASGWSPKTHQNAVAPAGGNKLNLSSMDDAGLVIEIDDELEDADEKFVTPRSDGQGENSGKATESANPFVKLEFTAEGKEYNSCDRTDTDTECGRAASAGVLATPAAELKDSHGTVNVTKITLNGNDVSTDLARVDKNQFSLRTRDLAVGTYTVAYTAVDDAGNEVEGTFKFNVEPREPYEIKVSPGWNLISLPATPLEPAIGSVLENNPYISPVLGYQEGDWVTAIQQEDGTWRGRLTEITGGYGYWVHARTFETVETMLAEADPASVLPTVAVTQGWNLLGVLDVYQNDAGEAPGAGSNGDEADNYLKSVPWRVAYTYATDRSLWIKTVPGSDTNVLDDEGNVETTTVTDEDGTTTEENVTKAEIVNGNGYWVWSTSPSVLAP